MNRDIDRLLADTSINIAANTQPIRWPLIVGGILTVSVRCISYSHFILFWLTSKMSEGFMFGSCDANSVCNASYSHQYASSSEADDRQNVKSLSIDMSADDWTTTLSWHIDQHIGRLLVNISTDARPIRCSICRRTHLSQHIGRVSTDMSGNILVDIRLIYRPIHRSSVGQYVDQYIGGGGAQNTHDRIV